ncbi:MAG: hypothetical protein J6U17_04255 [Kiritimatiellae bacterium]|nr:hypothetical protein [Kiritimatiellia bacterium]
MNKSCPVYVVCPAHVATGGTEAAHALCYELLKLDISAFMLYINVKDFGAVVHERFKRFNVPYVLTVEDSANAKLVIPETCTDFIPRFPLMTKYIWWLSVDNYTRPLKVCGPRDMINLLRDRLFKRNVNFKDASIVHMCQSQYAMVFVRRMGATNAHFLMDYLGKEHLEPIDMSAHREDVILYNPAKGLTFTRRIIKASPKSFRFIALQSMSPVEVHDWCRRAKVYIDFGNHPGKDRFPREAVMAGCIVITSRRGAAAFHEDMPIDDCYKFKDVQSEIPKIVDLISDCLEHYDSRQLDFEDYRAFIREDHQRFIRQTKAIFNH